MKNPCVICGAETTFNERGLCRKYLSRETDRFFCLPCLSVQLQTTEEALKERIRWFQEQGCHLFTPLSDHISGF